MKTQNLELAKTSVYRAPELYEIGTLDKVQGFGEVWLDYFFGIYGTYIPWF